MVRISTSATTSSRLPPPSIGSRMPEATASNAPRPMPARMAPPRLSMPPSTATVMPLSSSIDSDWSTPWMLPHSTPAVVATSDDSAHDSATPRSTEMPTAQLAM